jgi:hypothetical protein
MKKISYYITEFLIYIILVMPILAHADDTELSRTQLSPSEIADLDQRKSQMHDYLFSKSSGLFDWMPSGSVSTTGNGMLGLLAPVISVVQSPSKDVGEAVWLSPGYQHNHGIMPFDDAVSLGPMYRNKMLDNRLNMDIHPYYAQNWHNTDNYWGLDTTFGVGPSVGKSWGNITVGFTNGNENLMNHESGFNMKANLNFTNNLSLTSGVDQLDNATVLLRFHFVDFDK